MEGDKRGELYRLIRDSRQYYRLQARGNSMLPTIRPGARLLIEPSSREKLQLNDIIVFERNERLVAHRCLGRIAVGNRSWYLEKGDYNLLASIIAADRIIGKVIRIDDCERIPQASKHSQCGTIIGILFRSLYYRLKGY